MVACLLVCSFVHSSGYLLLVCSYPPFKEIRFSTTWIRVAIHNGVQVPYCIHLLEDRDQSRKESMEKKKKDICVDEIIFHQSWISWNLIWLDFLRQPFGLRSPEVLGVHPEICPTQIRCQVTPSRYKFSAKVSFSVCLGFVCSLLRLHVCACLRHLWAYLGCI